MPSIRITYPDGSDLKAASRAAMKAVGAAAATIIKHRTAQGRSADGGPFRPYTTDYRLTKIATGRDSGRVDLTFTGQMLGSVTSLRSDATVAVVGTSAAQHQQRQIIATGKRQFVSDVATKRTIRKRKAKATAKTVPMAKVVLGTHRLRPWLAIRLPEEIAEIVRVYRETFAAHLKQQQTLTK